MQNIDWYQLFAQPSYKEMQTEAFWPQIDASDDDGDVDDNESSLTTNFEKLVKKGKELLHHHNLTSSESQAEKN